MKINIVNSLILIGALTFASCSTQRMASNGAIEDDVYNTKARAGTLPDMPPPTYQQDVATDGAVPVGSDGQYYDSTGDNDYQYYDSYASRIDRFGYASPFGYYDDYYYTSPLYGGYGLGYPYGYAGLGFNYGLGLGYGYGGWGLGLGLGYGYGYPFGYGYGYPFGYGGYYGYGFGYGGYPYGGFYGGYGRGGVARPFRGSGAPGYAGLAGRGVGYAGRYPGVNFYPGRPVNTTGYGTRSTNGYGGNGNYNYGGRMRAPRTDYPGYQQQQQRSINSFQNNSSFGGRGSAPSGGGGGGGGGRPGRP